MAQADEVDDVKQNLQKLLAAYPCGIPLDDLATIYNNFFQRDLVLRRNGIKGVKGLPDAFNCFEIVVDKKTQMLRLKKEEKRKRLVKETTKGSKKASLKTIEPTEKMFANTVEDPAKSSTPKAITEKTLPKTVGRSARACDKTVEEIPKTSAKIVESTANVGKISKTGKTTGEISETFTKMVRNTSKTTVDNTVKTTINTVGNMTEVYDTTVDNTKACDRIVENTVKTSTTIGNTPKPDEAVGDSTAVTESQPWPLLQNTEDSKKNHKIQLDVEELSLQNQQVPQSLLGRPLFQTGTTLACCQPPSLFHQPSATVGNTPEPSDKAVGDTVETESPGPVLQHTEDSKKSSKTQLDVQESSQLQNQHQVPQPLCGPYIQQNGTQQPSSRLPWFQPPPSLHHGLQQIPQAKTAIESSAQGKLQFHPAQIQSMLRQGPCFQPTGYQLPRLPFLSQQIPNFGIMTHQGLQQPRLAFPSPLLPPRSQPIPTGFPLSPHRKETKQESEPSDQNLSTQDVHTPGWNNIPTNAVGNMTEAHDKPVDNTKPCDRIVENTLKTSTTIGNTPKPDKAVGDSTAVTESQPWPLLQNTEDGKKNHKIQLDVKEPSLQNQQVRQSFFGPPLFQTGTKPPPLFHQPSATVGNTSKPLDKGVRESTAVSESQPWPLLQHTEDGKKNHKTQLDDKEPSQNRQQVPQTLLGPPLFQTGKTLAWSQPSLFHQPSAVRNTPEPPDKAVGDTVETKSPGPMLQHTEDSKKSSKTQLDGQESSQLQNQQQVPQPLCGPYIQQNGTQQPSSRLPWFQPPPSLHRHPAQIQSMLRQGAYFQPTGYQLPRPPFFSQQIPSFGNVTRQGLQQQRFPTPPLPPRSQPIPTGFPFSPHRKETKQGWEPFDQNLSTPDVPTPGWNNISTSNMVAGKSDWPTLNQCAATKMTKKEMKKEQKVETENMSVFGASNMMEYNENKKDLKSEAENRRIKFDHLDASEIQNRIGGRKPTREELNSRALFHIQALSEQNEHVSVELVMKGVMEHFGQKNIRHLGLYKETDLEAIREHQRLLCRINAYISAFCKCRSIATLYELHKDLANIQDGKDSFEDLNVGPLCKFPEVYNMFKFPPYQSDDDIIKVTSMDILELLRDYMRENDLWRTKVDLGKFMEYVIDHFEVSGPYQLGIRVQSVALGVSVIKKAQREEKNTMDRCRQAIMEQLQQEVEASLQSVKKSILEPANIKRESSRLDNRRRYADMTAGEAILTVYENALPLLDGEPRLRNFCRSLPSVFNNDLAKNLFHLAVCLGNMEFPEEYRPSMNEEQPVEQDNEPAEMEAPVCTNKIPDEEEIISDVEKFLNRLHDVPTLLDLSTIESRLCQNRQLSSFLDFKKGTFLQFLTKTPKLLQQFGGSILGATNRKVTDGSPYHPSPHNLIDFIRQCGKQNMNDLKVVEMALCEHYQTTSVDNIGRGSLQRLISKAKNTALDDEQNCITYEQALCTQTRDKGHSNSKVGLRGHQSVCNALLVLNSAPLLDDLAEWSHWDLIFKPEHGDLKCFIEKWSGAEVPCEPEDYQLDEPITILALETRPGVLLKLASETSVDNFKSSAVQEDARLTAGHLVSIVTKNGIKNAPLTLLQNSFESALKGIFSRDVVSVPGGPPEKLDADAKVVSFVLDCLVLIPMKIGHATAEVFLKPLSAVIGDKVSKRLLKDNCVTTAKLNKLQQLGFLLGIVEWSETFDLKLECPKSDESEAASIDIATLLPQTEKLESDEFSMSQEEEDNSNCDVDDDFVDEEELDEDEATTPAGNDVPIPSEDIIVEDLEVKESMEVQDDVINPEEPDVGLDKDADTIDDQPEPHPEISSDDDTEEPVALTPCQEEMRHCKSVVDRIRKSEFGIGTVLSKEGADLMKSQTDRIARSLERLSSELYSKDTHFVLELVQNADDNTYGDECQQPSLLFQLEDGHITVYNNEKGFSAENIQALCDVGKSTKGKHKYGYIGHKGIGFKSVFRVTDRPEIHSSGFHICFDRQTDSLGFILPTWIGASKPQDVTVEDDVASKGWQTRIVLPLKDGVCKTNKLLNRFDDLQPSLLLFLHRLRSIQVVNQPKSTVTKMERIDHPKNVIEIKHTDGTDFWLVVKDMININESVCDRAYMESTELALAFPLPKDKGVSEIVLKDQYVFAYLPLRSYGFKFIIQGDFDIPSSREDVDSDSAWNQWIKQHLPALFIRALQFFKDYYGSKDEELAVCRFLQFVPVDGQILGFFESVAREIHQKLKSFPCLPVMLPDADGSTVWRQPAEAVIVHDSLVQELVSPAALHRHLGCYYLSNVVSSLLNTALLRSLGVKTITTSNLISLFKGEVLKAKADGVSLTVSSVAKWLTCIYRCRDAEHDISEGPMKEIQALPIIPLSNGMWTDLQEKSIFFSLTFENQRTDMYAPKKAAKKEMQGSIQILESDMYILHGDLLTCQDSLANSQVMLMMEQLGVCHIKPYDVIHNHILPTLRSEDWHDKPHLVLVSYVVYIKDQIQLEPDICKLEDLKQLVQIRTDRGAFVNPSREPVHFTKKYGNKYDLKSDLTGVEWTCVDDCYLTCSKQGSTTSAITQWHQFFAKLGVLNLMAIERKTLTLQKSAMDSSVWSREYNNWPASVDESYQIEDSRSKELEQLIENNTEGTRENRRVLINLLNILAKEWPNFSQFVDASLVVDNHGKKRTIESSFAKLLLRSSWIPTRPVLDPENGRKTEQRLLPPNQVFLFSQRLHGFLNEHVPYLDGMVSENIELIRFLQMNGENVLEDIKFLYDMLQGWCTRGKTSQPDEITKTGATFTTTIEHMLQVYIHLQMHSPPDQLNSFFENFPAIFLPTKPCERSKLFTGKFVHKSMTYWEDPTTLFRKYSGSTDRTSVIGMYEPISDFFQRHIRIDDTPSMLEYLQLLVKITSENQLPNVNVHADVLKIFGILGEKCAISGHTYDVDTDFSAQMASFLKGNLKGYNVFPTKANKWVSLEDQPMIVDEGSKEMEELFSSKQDINFLLEDTADNPKARRGVKGVNREETRQQEDFQRFLKACGVKNLSECVEHESIEELTQPCPKLKNLMHHIVPYIQTYLFTHFGEIHQNLISKVKMKSKLQIMNFMTASKLEVIYRLDYCKDGKQATAVETTKQNCAITRNFYVSKKIEDSINNDHSVRKEIARFFSDGNHSCQKGLQTFLILAMQRSKKLDDEFIRQENLTRIEDFELWEVEKVEEPKPIPIPPNPTIKVPQVKEEEGSTKRLEKDEEGSGIYSWPPKSSAYGVVHTEKGTNLAEEASLKQWPPPQPAQAPDTGIRPRPHLLEEGATNLTEEASSKQWPPSRPAQAQFEVQQQNTQEEFGTQISNRPANDSDSTKEGQTGDHQKTTAGPVNYSQTDVARSYGIERNPIMVDSKDSEIRQHPTNGTATNHLPSPGVVVGDAQFQTPPNPYRTAPRSTSSTPMTFSPLLTPTAYQLVEEEITPDLRDLPFFENSEIDVCNPNDELVGRCGEELVYNLLKNQYRNQYADDSTVHWANEQGETGTPYDIVIETTIEGAVLVEYVEVKATNTSEKKHFQISAKEVTFAQQKMPHYHLYRVYNTGKKDIVKICSLKNLGEKMLKKQVVLLMKI